MKMNYFCVVASDNLVEVYGRFRGVVFLHRQALSGLIALMMEAVNSCETSVCMCRTIRRNFPEDSYLQIEVNFNKSYYR
jgi:hypothetical protein